MIAKTTFWTGVCLVCLNSMAAAHGSPPWKISGDAVAIPGGFANNARKAAIAELGDAGFDDYVLTGTVLLDREECEWTLSVGGPPQAQKSDPAFPTLRISYDRRRKTYNLGTRAPDDSEPPDVSKPIPFTVTVVQDSVEMQLGGESADWVMRARVPANRRLLRTSFFHCKVSDLQIKPLPRFPLGQLPIRLNRRANVNLAAKESGGRAGPAIDIQSLSRGVVRLDGVDFLTIDSPEANAVDVSLIKRTMQGRSKAPGGRSVGVYAGYDFQVVGDQFSAIHLLAYSSGRAATIPQISVQVGTRAGTEVFAIEHDAPVPPITSNKSPQGLSSIPVKLADGKRGYLHHIRIPLSRTGNVTEYPLLNVEFTRHIETSFDAFMVQTMDLPSSAVILAATMERAPVKMSYTTAEPGNIFSDAQQAVFDVELTNRSDKIISGKVSAQCAGPGTVREQNPFWGSWKVSADYTLAPGETRKIPLDVAPKHRGVFACTIAAEAGGRLVQERQTTFARIAPDTRAAMEDSPFGIWCFWDGHSITTDPLRGEKLAGIMHKGGWRWTYGGQPSSMANGDVNAIRHLKDKYQVTLNFQQPNYGKEGRSINGKVRGNVYNKEAFDRIVVPWLAQARKNGVDTVWGVLHENRVDNALLRRFSEHLGGEPYVMPAAENAEYDLQYKSTVEFCRAIKAADPQGEIVAFNDYPQMIEQHLKRLFPSELFDVIGIEQANFHKQPERQGDWYGLLPAMHDLKRIQAKYGYNKPIWTVEALYHSTKPGKFDLHDQATIAVREAILGLALGIQRMAGANEVADCSDEYSRSNWGTAGMCFRDPEFNPKPSFGMYAWMTQVLDRTKFAGKLKHDSNSLHVLDFVKGYFLIPWKASSGSPIQVRDGELPRHVYPIWVVSGRQTVTLKVEGGKAAVYDAYGNAIPVEATGGKITVTVGDAPIYVTGTTIAEVTSHEPLSPSADAPTEGGSEGQPLLDSDALKTLKLVESPCKTLEDRDIPNNIKVPYPIQGKYKLSPSQDGLRIELLPDEQPARRDLIPRYVQLALPQPLELPGRPFALDLQVQGNGGWGQIMLELIDAKGTTWTSARAGECESLGTSYITFDGWKTMRIHLPGQNILDKTRTWFANDDWINDKDQYDENGRKKTQTEVAWPLKLKRIIVTMRPSILYVDEQRPVADKAVTIRSVKGVAAPEGM